MIYYVQKKAVIFINGTKHKSYISSARLVAVGFFILIFLGAFLLSLPVSSNAGTWTPFTDALFTSASATCVTGLIVYDTFTHWSFFGQAFFFLYTDLAPGFLTVHLMFILASRHKMSLHERKLIMESSGALQLDGINTLIKRIAIGTVIIEGTGAVLLSIRFIPMLGFGRGVWFSVFHSVSAFCNAGFDIMGGESGPFSSFVGYESDALVSCVLSALIIIGGIGFLVWSDICKNGFHFKKYTLHTKIALSMTLFLIISGWIVFFFTEYNASMASLPFGGKLLSSFFQSVTTRTAGFNTIDQSALSGTGNAATMVLMLIGGCPGSTAGGIKTTTLAVIFLTTVASARNIDGVNVFKKRIDDSLIRRASSIFTIYLSAVLVITSIISSIEGIAFADVLYEVISGIGTVGLSKGIIPGLGVISKLILAATMYAGRIGGLSLALVFFENPKPVELVRPSEKILIG